MILGIAKRCWNASQTVAGDDADRMIAFMRPGRRIQEIAAKLADILEEGGPVIVDVGPEFMHREFAADHQRAAGGQGHTRCAYAAGRMIHRERVVHAVALACIQGACEAVHHIKHAHVAEIRGLGQARRS